MKGEREIGEWKKSWMYAKIESLRKKWEYWLKGGNKRPRVKFGFYSAVEWDSVFWSQSRNEPKLLVGAGAVIKFRLRLLTQKVMASGQKQEFQILIWFTMRTLYELI